MRESRAKFTPLSVARIYPSILNILFALLFAVFRWLSVIYILLFAVNRYEKKRETFLTLTQKLSRLARRDDSTILKSSIVVDLPEFSNSKRSLERTGT